MPRRKLKIIMVEDNEDDAQLILRELEIYGFDIEYSLVMNARDFKKKLKRNPDVVISDYSLPVFSGLDALDILTGSKLNIPFIIVSGVIGEELAVDAMKAGAHDYILKDSLKRLGPAIDRELREAEDRRARQEAEAALSVSAAELAQKNAALREILAQIEMEKQQLRRLIQTNVDKVLLPFIRNLRSKASGLGEKEIDILERNLKELTQEYGLKASGGMTSLSPRQIEVCNLIRGGMATKEIADFLSVSIRTVETHRNEIRKKLGISGSKYNLAVYLNRTS